MRSPIGDGDRRRLPSLTVDRLSLAFRDNGRVFSLGVTAELGGGDGALGEVALLFST